MMGILTNLRMQGVCVVRQQDVPLTQGELWHNGCGLSIYYVVGELTLE